MAAVSPPRRDYPPAAVCPAATVAIAIPCWETSPAAPFTWMLSLTLLGCARESAGREGGSIWTPKPGDANAAVQRKSGHSSASGGSKGQGILPGTGSIHDLPTTDGCPSPPTPPTTQTLIRRGTCGHLNTKPHRRSLTLTRMTGATLTPAVGILAPVPTHQAPLVPQALVDPVEREDEGLEMLVVVEVVVAVSTPVPVPVPVPERDPILDPTLRWA